MSELSTHLCLKRRLSGFSNQNFVKINVKFNLEQVTKAQGESRVVALLFL